MHHAIIRIGDGYANVSADTFMPETLLKKLRYWHRDFTTGPRGMVATGEYRELYTLSGSINADQQPCQELVTMPGFVHKIKGLLANEGFEVTLVDERTPLPAPDYEAAFEGLRDYQCECVYTALASGGGVIACPTGWGKTHVMGAMIKAFKHDELAMRGTPTIVVATPEKDITRKDYEDLKAMLPDRDVGLVMSGSKKFSDDVQVVTLDSLHLLDQDDIGILIVDEVHTAASSTRSESIMACRRAARWGVSATPTGRFDGRDLVTEGLFGPPVYQRTYAQGITDGALVPITVYWLLAEEPHIGLAKYFNFKTRTGKYRNGVDRNRNQNRQIIDLLARVPKERQTLCIMPHIDQMDLLTGMNKTLRYVHSKTDQAGLAKDGYHNVGPVSMADRRKTYDEMRDGVIRQILSTYVYKQGVNFPELEVIVNAGGGGSEIVAAQIPGRESRNIEGKTGATLIDFWHPWDMVSDKDGKRKPGPIHADDRSREKTYEDLGFKQFFIKSIDELPVVQTANTKG